jgi:hypothetical protein
VQDSLLVEDWGEKNTGKISPKVFILDVEAKTIQKVAGQKESASYGQPQWTPEGGLLMVRAVFSGLGVPESPRFLDSRFLFGCGVFFYFKAEHVQVARSFHCSAIWSLLAYLCLTALKGHGVTQLLLLVRSLIPHMHADNVAVSTGRLPQSTVQAGPVILLQSQLLTRVLPASHCGARNPLGAAAKRSARRILNT